MIKLKYICSISTLFTVAILLFYNNVFAQRETFPNSGFKNASPNSKRIIKQDTFQPGLNHNGINQEPKQRTHYDSSKIRDLPSDSTRMHRDKQDSSEMQSKPMKDMQRRRNIVQPEPIHKVKPPKK